MSLYYTSPWMDWGTYPVTTGCPGGNISFSGLGVGNVHTTPPNYTLLQSDFNGAFAAADAVLMGADPTFAGYDGGTRLEWRDAIHSFFPVSSNLKVWARTQLWGVTAWALYTLGGNSYWPALQPRIGVMGYYKPDENNVPYWLDPWGNPYPEPYTRAWPTMVSPVTGDILEPYYYTFQTPYSTIVSANLRYQRNAQTSPVSHPSGEPANPVFGGSRTATLVIGDDPAQPWTTPSNSYGHYLYDNSSGNPGWLPAHSAAWTPLDTISLSDTPTMPSGEVINGHYVTNGGPIDITSYLVNAPYYGTAMLTNTYQGSLNRNSSTSRAMDIYLGCTPIYVDWVMQYPLVQFHYYENEPPPPPPPSSTVVSGAWGIQL